MSDATGRRLLICCIHCQQPVLLTERVRDAELSQLRQHILDHHPDKAKGLAPRVTGTMRHFWIKPEPGPPDAA